MATIDALKRRLQKIEADHAENGGVAFVFLRAIYSPDKAEGEAVYATSEAALAAWTATRPDLEGKRLNCMQVVDCGEGAPPVCGWVILGDTPFAYGDAGGDEEEPE